MIVIAGLIHHQQQTKPGPTSTPISMVCIIRPNTGSVSPNWRATMVQMLTFTPTQPYKLKMMLPPKHYY